MTLQNFDIPGRIFATHQRVRAANDALRPPRDSTSPFYPSELGGCGRKITYSMSGYPSEGITGRTARIFQMGDIVEANVIQELRHAHFLVTNCEQDCDQKCNHGQKRVKIRHPFISGRVDGVITGVIDGESVTRLLELKSMNTRGFADLKLRGVRATQPKYYAQIQVYMFGMNLSEATVVVENKDTQDLYEEGVAYDELFVADLFIHLQMVRRYADAGKLAPPEYPKTSFECRFCAYSKECPGLPAEAARTVSTRATISNRSVAPSR